MAILPICRYADIGSCRYADIADIADISQIQILKKKSADIADANINIGTPLIFRYGLRKNLLSSVGCGSYAYFFTFFFLTFEMVIS